MRKSIFLFIIILLCASLHAQEKVEIYGYFESQVMGAKVKKDLFQLYTNKLRVDLKSELTDNITFAANFDYITYHGKKNWNILDFLSSGITSQIPETMNPFYVIPFSDRNFLDNAYIKVAFEGWDLTVGKQQISLGTGYVWNPTDVFNIKDVLDPSYEQPGHNAARVDIPVGTDYTLTALYSPEDTWNTSGKLIQFKGRISRFDYAVTGIEKSWLYHDYTSFDLQRMNFSGLPEKRRLLGLSTAGELLGLGVWAEYAKNDMEHSQDFYEVVIGGDYTFDFQTYVMVEFYRNSLGKSDYMQYDLNDWMRQFAAEQKSISKDQFYTYLQHPVSDFISLGASCIYSISDKSMALVPTVNYSFSENMEIISYLNFNFGKEGKVFGKNTGSGGMLRARIYF
ncbi:hypothetical protein ACFL4T_14050 [candidate division KSB1 bacterium]